MYLPILSHSLTTLTSRSYPVLSATDVRTSKILLIVVVVLHAALAIAIKFLFFSYKSPAKGIVNPSGDEKPAMFFGM
jgi:hypothetical protein